MSPCRDRVHWLLRAVLLSPFVVACGGGKPAAAPGATPEASSAVCDSVEACEGPCEAGDGASCNSLGALYETGKAAEQDYQRASELYEKACQLGEMTGCYNLAVLLEIGLGGPEDRSRASELYREACSGGNQRACDRTGE